MWKGARIAINENGYISELGALEIAEAYHQFPKKVVPKKHLWSSICIIWGYFFGCLGLGFTKNGGLEIAEAYHQFVTGYFFGCLGLGFVTGIIEIEVPCVSDMIGG